MKRIKDFGKFYEETEYEINGVRYIVSSKFKPINICKIDNTINDKLKKYLGGDFAPLTKLSQETTIQAEYVMTAGEEEKCSQTM